LVEHIETKLELKVKQNKNNDWGVETMDLNAGSYRFKRGVALEVVLTKEQLATNKTQEIFSKAGKKSNPRDCIFGTHDKGDGGGLSG